MTADGDLIGADEAASIAGVTRDRLDAMVEEGLLTPERGDGDAPRFLRAEVEAVAHLGG
jgi:hypothetical protein